MKQELTDDRLLAPFPPDSKVNFYSGDPRPYPHYF